MADKQKLTLSVDSDVVEKAKALDLNISEITEQVLRGFTFEPSAEANEETLKKYKELFKAMIPALEKFRTSTKIGEIFIRDYVTHTNTEQKDDLYLSYTGEIYSDIVFNEDIMYAEAIDNLDLKSLKNLDAPQFLLGTFIDSLVKGAERQKETIKELEATKRIIEAISTSLFSKTVPQQPTGNKKSEK